MLFHFFSGGCDGITKQLLRNTRFFPSGLIP
jgi:hypothetical protein